MLMAAEAGLFILGQPPPPLPAVPSEPQVKQWQWCNQQYSWLRLMKTEAYWGLARAAAKVYVSKVPTQEVDMIIFDSWGDWAKLLASLSRANRERLVELSLSAAARKSATDKTNPSDTNDPIKKAPAGRGAGRGKDE